MENKSGQIRGISMPMVRRERLVLRLYHEPTADASICTNPSDIRNSHGVDWPMPESSEDPGPFSVLECVVDPSVVCRKYMATKLDDLVMVNMTMTI